MSNSKSIKNTMKTLQTIYFPGYEFPTWSIDTFDKNYSKLGKKVKVYYDDSPDIDIETIKIIVSQREPVNIAMKRFYDQDKMKSEFGWKTGYYGEYYDKHKTPAPNIAIYCQTPVNNTKTHVHIINSIGLAFDTVSQPDYKFFIKNEKNTKYIEQIYQYSIFPKIYQCAKDNKLKTVVMSLVGANNFAHLYQDEKEELSGIDDFQSNVWSKAFFNFINKNKSIKNIKTVFMGAENSIVLKTLEKMFTKSQLKSLFKIKNNKIIDIGYFPDNIQYIDIKDTLFVNAWDPWSFAGNGHQNDNSLDGYIGRNTAICVLCSPITNKYLKLKKSYIKTP